MKSFLEKSHELEAEALEFIADYLRTNYLDEALEITSYIENWRGASDCEPYICKIRLTEPEAGEGELYALWTCDLDNEDDIDESEYDADIHDFIDCGDWDCDIPLYNIINIAETINELKNSTL